MGIIRCHTVPQFYLSYFLPPACKCFWVYDKKGISVRQQTPINTTVIKDYYISDPDQNGNKNTQMEEFLSNIEGITKPIFDKWLTMPATLDKNDISIAALFLAFAHTRVPRTVEAVKEIANVGVEKVIEKMKRDAEDQEGLHKQYEDFLKSPHGKDIDITYEEFFELMADPTKHVTFRINEKHAVGQSLNLVGNTCKLLTNMCWGIRYIKGDHFFITSDAPVNVFVPTNDGRAIFGGGLAQLAVQIAFPLSPRICLWIRRKPIKPCERIHAGFVKEINRRTAWAAERYVISPYRSNNVMKIVKELSSSYGKAKLDTEFIKRHFFRHKQGGNE